MSPEQAQRIKGALYGLILGDALGMPVHWYYSTANLKADYGNIEEVVAPLRYHPESMADGMSYNGTIDIMFDKAHLYEGHLASELAQKSVGETKIPERDLVGNLVGKEAYKRTHYHSFLKRGQNTYSGCLTRLLMRYLHEKFETVKLQNNESFFEVYDPEEWLTRFYKYCTTDPRGHQSDIAQIHCSNDTYTDLYLRYFFEQASRGVPLNQCAQNQRQNWSIGSLDSIVFAVPLVLAYVNEPENFLLARAVEHQMLTHKSLTVTAALYSYIPFLQKLVKSSDPNEHFDQLLDEAMDKHRPPKLSGAAMGRSYKENKGPGNIPKDKKWQQHMETTETSLKTLIRRLISEKLADEQVAGFITEDAYFSTACYPEHGLPLIYYLLCRYGDDTKKCMTVNAQLGGHTTMRGALLGAILGVKNGFKSFPKSWLESLAAPGQVENEVAGVVNIAVNRH